ncbi:MAG: HAD family hydrolase [Spirochaetales bacterium]|nr:HAD family hydrolase [Spirochaetales bacterium]
MTRVPLSLPAIRAVACDIDGTLYPSAAINLHCLDLLVQHPLLLSAFARVRKEIRVLQLEPGYAPRSQSELHDLQHQLVARHLRITRERAASLVQSIFYHEVPARFGKIVPFAGVFETLELLKRRKIVLAALSDLPVHPKLELLGLDQQFDLALCSETWGRLKPDPLVFQQLCANLGCDPEQVLYVGNNPHYDIEGARAAGMHTAYLGRHRTHADFTFVRWIELIQWLEALPSSP